MRAGILEKDYKGVAYSTARNELPDQPAGNRTLDRAELSELRRAAARLERPEAGIFLRVTEDGRAIATGQKGQRIPDAFRKFAEDNDLTLTAERRIPKYDRSYLQTSGQLPVSARSEPMPIEYRENGAMYFGEMGGEALDRTGMARFSARRKALLDMQPVEVSFDTSGAFGDAKLRARAAYIKLQKATQDNGYGAVTTDGKRVKFSMSGFKEATHHAADRRVLALIANAKTLVESALPMYSEAPAAPEQGVRRYHYYATKVRSNGDEAFALVEIKETTNGEWFYDTDATDVETARAIYSAALADQTESGAGDTKHTALGGRLAKWFAGVNDPIVKKSPLRPTTNSNGKPIHPTEEGIRNFWRWFGDSKVVDDEGRPLVVYHGGSVGNVFDVKHNGTGGGREVGFFFTPDIRQARDYAGSANVKSVFLRIQNPLYTDYQLDPAEVEQAKADGHDGYWLIEDGLVDESEIVAFSPTQIKSATGNNGQFDPNNLDIRYSLQRSGFKPNDPFLVDGSPDIAQLPAEIASRTGGRFLAKPVRLLNGKHFGKGKGYGFAHINAGHGAEIPGDDPLKAAKYAIDVVRNTTKIYDDGSGRLILQNVGAPKGVAFVELRDDGGYYSIVTVFNGKERGRLIWSGRRLHLSSKGSGDMADAMTTTAEQSGSPSAATDQLPINPKQPLETLADQTSEKNIAPDNDGIKRSRSRITVDGISRPTTNSNGKPIHPTEEGIRNFWKWFKNSSVVDAEGKPLVVYHGTTGNRTVFEPYWKQLERDAMPRELIGNGTVAKLYRLAKDEPELHFFAAERGVAESYGPNVVEAYLAIENMVGNPAMSRDEAIRLMLDLDADGAVFSDTTSGGNFGGAAYVVRRPTQIKSATGNTGAFDGSNPDIRYSTERTPAETAELRDFLNGPPLAKLNTSEAPHKGYEALKDWVMGIFSDYGFYASNPEVGRVALDERAIRKSMGHSMNPFKAVAFKAVPDVIENGRVVLKERKHNLDTFYISAPVEINGVDDMVTVLVHRDVNTQRMYLHSVTTKENLLQPSQSSADAKASERSGTVASGGIRNVLHEILNFKDIKRSNSRQPAAFQLQETDRLDNVIYKLQDKQIDLKRVVQTIRETGKKIEDVWNPYLQEELYHGRSAKAVKDFNDFELRPLLQDMQMRGISMADFETYLHNRHAEEANRHIAKINPNNPEMQDGGSQSTLAFCRRRFAGFIGFGDVQQKNWQCSESEQKGCRLIAER